MKKYLVVFLLITMLYPVFALDFENGLSFGGGVKTGLLVRNSDYGGRLGNIALSPDHKYPMTLHFASYENQARSGEAWLSLGYNQEVANVGKFGLGLGMWAHGNIESFDNALRVGDHYVWANFFGDRLRLIGGQGGGTPITSGGWINADWLSYTGLRFFWVDPIGLSIGINFPDPNEEGIKPVNYLSLLAAGASYKINNWWISLQFINSPIYDDSEANYYGGLHRSADEDPIAQKGNAAFGMGMDNIYGGKGFLALEGLFTNLGEDEERGMGNYMISQVASTFAVKTGYPITDDIYVEVKGKYTISNGDNDDFTASTTWGKLELEPYVSFKPFSFLRFDLAVYWAAYFNSYYLALDATSQTTYPFNAGQAPGYSMLLDFLSPYQFVVKPRVSLTLSGLDIDFGYSGSFSRDHSANILYLDFRWMF